MIALTVELGRRTTKVWRTNRPQRPSSGLRASPSGALRSHSPRRAWPWRGCGWAQALWRLAPGSQSNSQALLGLHTRQGRMMLAISSLAQLLPSSPSSITRRQRTSEAPGHRHEHGKIQGVGRGARAGAWWAGAWWTCGLRGQTFEISTIDPDDATADCSSVHSAVAPPLSDDGAPAPASDPGSSRCCRACKSCALTSGSFAAQAATARAKASAASASYRAAATRGVHRSCNSPQAQ